MTAIPQNIFNQLTHWFEKLAETLLEGHWNKFDEKYRCVSGFVHTLASTPETCSLFLEFLHTSIEQPCFSDIISAVDRTTDGIIQSKVEITYTNVFHPPLTELDKSAIKLVQYVKLAPSMLDPGHQESGKIIRRSLGLRQLIGKQVTQSIDYQQPHVEAIIIYLFGSLIINTSAADYHSLLGNTNHIPFYFELIFNSAESVLNYLRQYEEMSESPPSRKKGEKFGILDSPSLQENDIIQGKGIFGVGCLYFDIDNFKKINTKYSERIVDRDLLPEYQSLIVKSIEYTGFAYAEGGDEVLIILPNKNLSTTIEIAKIIMEAISASTFKIEDEEIGITVSMGIAHFKAEEAHDNLVEKANKAMRKAKEEGKNIICIYTGTDIEVCK